MAEGQPETEMETMKREFGEMKEMMRVLIAAVAQPVQPAAPAPPPPPAQVHPEGGALQQEGGLYDDPHLMLGNRPQVVAPAVPLPVGPVNALDELKSQIEQLQKTCHQEKG